MNSNDVVREISRRAALSAGEVLLKYFLCPTLSVTTKSHAFDFVTDADKEAENTIKDILLSSFPDDSFLGEESERLPGISGREWVVDPLDGTRNFVSGLPYWCVSIGLRENGKVRHGVIYQPVTGAIWESGDRCIYKNGIKLDPPPVVNQIRDGLCVITTSLDPSTQSGRIREINDLSIGLANRKLGSSALELAHLAEGSLCAAFFEISKLSDWDICAGSALCHAVGLNAAWYKPVRAGLPDRFIAGPEHIVIELERLTGAASTQ